MNTIGLIVDLLLRVALGAVELRRLEDQARKAAPKYPAPTTRERQRIERELQGGGGATAEAPAAVAQLAD